MKRTLLIALTLAGICITTAHIPYPSVWVCRPNAASVAGFDFTRVSTNELRTGDDVVQYEDDCIDPTTGISYADAGLSGS